jgi:hypothetical protein
MAIESKAGLRGGQMDEMKLRPGGCADPVAALNPLAMFKEADSQRSIEIALPDQLKLALDGSLPAVKQKHLPTQLDSAEKFPKQQDINPPFPDASPVTKGTPKVFCFSSHLYPLQFQCSSYIQVHDVR